jgi:nitrogen regulatory protein P-II 1
MPRPPTSSTICEKVLTMKLITAIVKPARVEYVKDALRAAGITGMTLSEVRGYGQQGGHIEMYRGAEHHIEFIPKARIEIIVEEPDQDRTIGIIMQAARTGKIGDGKIWVTDVSRLIRIRTGDEGNLAI